MDENMKMSPFRQIDDFILGTARFELPPYKDLERWANRIVANLLYYQTNYFALILIVFLLVGVFQPKEMTIGFLAVTAAFVAFATATSTNDQAVQFKKDHLVATIFLVGLVGYFLVLMISNVIVFLFGMALPMLLMFIHASLRLRNIRSKIASKAEGLGLRKSPMGMLLETVGIDLERIVF